MNTRLVRSDRRRRARKLLSVFVTTRPTTTHKAFDTAHRGATAATHTRARPLHPEALAIVPYGAVLVRVRVLYTAAWPRLSTAAQWAQRRGGAGSVNDKPRPLPCVNLSEYSVISVNSRIWGLGKISSFMTPPPSVGGIGSRQQKQRLRYLWFYELALDNAGGGLLRQ